MLCNNKLNKFRYPLMDTMYNNIPCIVVAMTTAFEEMIVCKKCNTHDAYNISDPQYRNYVYETLNEFNRAVATSHSDGYTTLDDANKYIRSIFKVKKRHHFNRNDRPALSTIHLIDEIKDEKCIICVKGHYIYYNGRSYFSAFDNDLDEIIEVWVLGSIKNDNNSMASFDLLTTNRKLKSSPQNSPFPRRNTSYVRGD